LSLKVIWPACLFLISYAGTQHIATSGFSILLFGGMSFSLTIIYYYAGLFHEEIKDGKLIKIAMLPKLVRINIIVTIIFFLDYVSSTVTVFMVIIAIILISLDIKRSSAKSDEE
jgi:hypothetical protein